MNIENKRVLMTGGAGLISSNIAEETRWERKISLEEGLKRVREPYTAEEQRTVPL